MDGGEHRVSHVLGRMGVLLALWVLLSGKLDLLHAGAGAIAAALIALRYLPGADGRRFRIVAFVRYVPWFLGQVLLSNLRVARVVLTPRMPIAPAFLRQPPGVTGARALTLLGSSVTLTPGTLTIDIGPDEIFVHALDTASARDVQANVLARRASRIFEEPRT